jgi:DNA-binding MarR family transcriptional regulator
MLNDSTGESNGTDADICSDLLMRLFNKAAMIEREPVDTGDGVLLYTSEVHLIDMAGRFPEERLSTLASRLGITKGAISQTVKKLEEKGYLERTKTEGNNKTVLIRLTDAGLRVFYWHRAYHAVVNDRILQEMSDFSRKDRDNFQKILIQIEKIFDDCPETRRRITQGSGEKRSGKT